MTAPEQDRLTGVEYEFYYSEALRILHYKHDSVGMPYYNDNGERICRIDRLHADDRTVFLLAFGSDVAHEIENGRPVHIRSRSARKRG